MHDSCQLTPYITELPVLEDEEALASRNVPELSDCPVGEIADDVGMGLEEAYRIADLFGKLEQFGGGSDVGGEA